MRVKLFVSVIVAGLAVAFVIWNIGGAEGEGEIDVVVVENEETVIDDSLPYAYDDTLYTVLDAHYEIETSSDYGAALGRTLLVIDDVETDFYNTFFHISIDGEAAKRGIDHIELLDGATYTFEVREPYGE